MDEADATDRRTDTRETSRRGYLLGAGAMLGSFGLLNGASGRVAAATDYETITVGAGETFRKTVGSGETWENVLIDISEPGAVYDIQADGTDWTIRNVGITGHFEGGHAEPFRARVTDPDGTGTIENVCLDVTCGDGNATGLYVYWDHAGHLEIDRVNVQNWTDNGIYASGPGNSNQHPIPGAGGTVAIRNSYAKNNDVSNFRLGTRGSTLENSCAAGGSQRGHWQFYEDAEIVDCDIGGHESDLALGDAVWNKSDDASLTMVDARWESETAHGGARSSSVSGTSAGVPWDSIPEGCPRTAEEAANGGGVEDPHEPRTLDVAGQFAYRIEVTEKIRPAAEHAELLEEGDAYGDDWAEWWLSGSDEARTAWEFTGEITTLEIDDHDGETEIRTLAVDGESIDPV
ncbi:hypothetical protein [Halovivax gelatinilyticus]|uniref:hypothetical protein n=1 Tax=Halovivax gelatinilyticus TaxID=2961597 RepID=UPI0020CA6B70|nr:hypothetical protein [Halovivax gelatinilyticus]